MRLDTQNKWLQKRLSPGGVIIPQDGWSVSGPSLTTSPWRQISQACSHRRIIQEGLGIFSKRKKHIPPCVYHMSDYCGRRRGRWFGMNVVLWNLKSDCTGSLLLLWQLPLRDFAVPTCRLRSVWKEINPWWVAEEGEMRSLVSGSDGALKPGIGSSWTWREEWSYMVTDSLPVCSHLKANKTPRVEVLLREYQVATLKNNGEVFA